MTELDLQHSNAPASGDNTELLQTYRQMLAGHDWYYAMSDDPTAYRQGALVRTQLSHLRQALDQDYKIWNEYAPSEYQVK